MSKNTCGASVGGAACRKPGARECGYKLRGRKEGQVCGMRLCVTHAGSVVGRHLCPPHERLVERGNALRPAKSAS